MITSAEPRFAWHQPEVRFGICTAHRTNKCDEVGKQLLVGTSDFFRLTYPTFNAPKVRRWRLPATSWKHPMHAVACPSGLRGGTQVAIASAAQVRTLPRLIFLMSGAEEFQLHEALSLYLNPLHDFRRKLLLHCGLCQVSGCSGHQWTHTGGVSSAMPEATNFYLCNSRPI